MRAHPDEVWTAGSSYGAGLSFRPTAWVAFGLRSKA